MSQSALQSTKEYPVGVFTSVFTGAEAFLADHVIQGKKILPGMAYLEITRAAVANSVAITEDYMIVLKDSIFLNALTLDKEKRSVDVKVYPGANGEFGIEVSTKQGVHFQSKAYIRRKSEQRAEAAFPNRLDIPALEEACSMPGPVKSAFYATFKRRGVELGPSHQGIEYIKLGDKQGLVKVSIPGASQRGMVMDPGLLDSIIQGGVAMAADPEENVVPFAVQQTKVFAPLTDIMYVHMVKTEDGLDYIAADEDGEVRVVVNGFMTREIDLNANKNQLVFYKPSWKIAENQDASLNETVINIDGGSSYLGLVQKTLNIAKQLIQSSIEEQTLEVHIPEHQPAWKGVEGALKTITQESSKISTRLKVGNEYKELEFSLLDMTTAPEYSWKNDKTILITGGLGGLGKLFAKDIAINTTSNTLILVGRSHLNEQKQSEINELESLGVKVIYTQCDITDENQVKALLSEYPGVNGIIHGSGTLKDNLITKKTDSEVADVMAPKVFGLNYLDEATKAFELDFFVVLSSIAGVLGNAGQFDYAAANAYMDAFISLRAQQVEKGERKGKSLSINWPLWDSEGMQIDEATKQNLIQVLKIKPLSAEHGIKALKQLIASSHKQAVVAFGSNKSISGMFEKAKAPETKHGKRTVKGVESSKLVRALLQEVRNQTSEHLKLKPSQLDDYADWSSFGFDSILLTGFVNRFNAEYELNLMPTVLFEATNIYAFSEYLAENHSGQMAKCLDLDDNTRAPKKRVVQRAKTMEEPNQEKISSFAHGFRKSYKSSVSYRDKDVAIVGMSCKVAGASNPEEFWKMLDEERDMISEIPKDRWDWEDYPGVSKWGSFIDDVDKFDALFFGISPAEAMYMNPEQRLMMQYVWECIENAGYGGDDIRGNNTGLFIGCGPSGYSSLLHGLPIEAYSATGTVSSVGPNRISYFMDWHGPSNPIDTACSSALVALHRAVEVVRAGHCDQAIAGGVNLLLAPDGYISFSKSGMLCEDGRCKTFSDKANGYVRGEGIGMLMVKPLKAALRDGNTIHALVKGTAENHGGRTNSLTAPNPKSQASVIKQAVKDAGVDFSRVSYIECHGTGTELGDPVEIRGLKMVANDLLEDNSSDHTCMLGSVKSNIGHLEYGAGVGGLIKVIMQIKNKKIARSLHCESINPYIDLKGTPFKIAQQANDWAVEPGQTRIAGVSSFGFGGANAHIVLEEYIDPEIESQRDENEVASQIQIITISAKSKEALLDYVAQLPDYIQFLSKDTNTLKRVAYTSQVGRAEMQERVAFVVHSLDEWSEQVKAFLENKGKIFNRKIFRGSVKANSSNNIELGDTDAGKDYIKQLIADNESEKIAELWIKGTRINWSSLHTS